MSATEKKELNMEEIDRNFAVNSDLGRDDIRFFDVKKTPEFLFGLRFDEDRFFRMPEDFAANFSDGMFSLNRCTSGGRVRFRTNSPFVAISIQLSRHEVMRHMAPSGSTGFDLYVDGRFFRAFLPSAGNMLKDYDRIEYIGNGEEHEILIHFPLYNRVEHVHIGVQENAWVTEAKPYAVERPVVFYGSSITQGGCVSRPGIAYPAYISRWFNCDFVNLGFSGNAKGEQSMAEYVASLDPSVFVMDYDHNTPTYEHLVATHYAFYKRFRELRPTTPVVMVTAPDVRWYPNLYARRDLIRRNYEAAVAAGDDRVFFVDGESLMGGDDWDSCTVDGSHPNDLGHYMMAKGIAPAVKEALALIKK